MKKAQVRVDWVHVCLYVSIQNSASQDLIVSTEGAILN